MKSGKSRKAGWTDRFKSKKSARWFDRRLVPVGGAREDPLTSSNSETQVKFCDNHIKSSKYNIFTFWIINPLEQFRRIANAYFLLGKWVSFGPFKVDYIDYMDT